MRSCFVSVLVLFSLNIIHAQSAVDFLMSYNKHIDPLGKLDTIRLLTMQIKSEAKYILNAKSGEMNYVRSCEFYSDGNRKCIDIENGTPKDLEIFPIPSEYLGNPIKYQLNFIPVDSVENFSIKMVNDSITVIERDFKSKGKRMYTFDNKTKHLLQSSTVRFIDGTSIDHTNFQSYQTVNGIVVAKKVTVTFDVNSESLKLQTNASVEYQDVAFK